MIGNLDAIGPLLDGAGEDLWGSSKGALTLPVPAFHRARDHLWDEGEAQRRVYPAEGFVVELLDAQYIFGGFSKCTIGFGMNGG